MTPLPYLSIHRVSGADAGSFLHAQVAANTGALANGEASFAAYCSPRGQVIALLLVYRSDPDWFLVSDAGLASMVAGRLRTYVLRSRVVIEPVPELQVAGLAAAGPDVEFTGVFAPGSTPLRYALGSPARNDLEDWPYWRREEIAHGVIWLQNATTERFLPQMLGLDAIGAVSFSKGCYPGQEIIARTRYLGRLKRHPVLLEVQGSTGLEAGDNCTLLSAGEHIESVVADVVCPDRATSTMMLVAPVEAGRRIDGIESPSGTWSARRIGATGEAPPGER